MKIPTLVLVLAATLGAASPREEYLHRILAGRFEGDRSGVWVAAAWVSPEGAVAGIVAADPALDRKLDEHSRFEIGNLSKTMTAALAAEQVVAGTWRLDQPLAELLPAGTSMPAGLTLGQLLTHRSGLPALPTRMKPADPANPYADLTPAQVLGSLADLPAQGGTPTYSHFGMMLVSTALARQAGKPFPALLEERLFKPLGMTSAGVGGPVAAGHASNGRPVPAWDFPADLAGAGGVRASLADLTRYLQAELGQGPAPVVAALRRTQAAPPLNWSTVPMAGRTVLVHEGQTAGHSALIALDPSKGQGVVLLADTALGNLGGLQPVALAVLDPGAPSPGLPRQAAQPGEQLLTDLAGPYLLPGAVRTALEAKDGHLVLRIEGRPDLDLAFDTAGDFYARAEDLVVHPVRTTAGYEFVLRQGGGQAKAERLRTVPALGAQALGAYAGDYELAPGFVLKVTVRGAGLVVQGTGQAETPVAAVGQDVFVSSASGAEFTFKRGADGQVTGIVVRQGGRSLAGPRR